MSHNEHGLDSATTEHNEDLICSLISREAEETMIGTHRICSGCNTRLTRYSYFTEQFRVYYQVPSFSLALHDLNAWNRLLFLFKIFSLDLFYKAY